MRFGSVGNSSAIIIKKAGALRNYLAHYHGERNHQGKDNILLFPTLTTDTYTVKRPVACRERLGGLLKYYYQEAA